jgi:hypothetical protein
MAILQTLFMTCWEGVLPFEMTLVIKEFVETDNIYFIVEDFNNIISTWSYDPPDAENKPVTIPSSFEDTIKQNAG